MLRGSIKIRYRSKDGTRTPGRAGATLFFLFWLAIPSVLLGFVVRELWADVRTWSWAETDCTILESRVEEIGSEPTYGLSVRYAYSPPPTSALAASSRTGFVVSRGYRGDADYAVAQRLALAYAPGKHTHCYVNPADPGEAVLQRNGLWKAVLLPLPLLFIAIGAGGLWFTWRDVARAADGGPPITSGEITTRIGGRRAATFTAVFFLIFFVVGSAVLVAMGGKVVSVFGAGEWMPVDAVVVSSRIRTHHGDDDTTYSPDVLYRYQVNGREYRSNRFGFVNGSGGYDRARAASARFTPGTHFTAYVNPADPTDAVIERGLTPDMFVLLVPLVFMAVGGIGAFYSVRAGLARHGDRASAGTSQYVASARWQGALYVNGLARSPAQLKPRQSPGLKLLGLTIAAVFWNGIVSVFLYQVVSGWTHGRPDLCLSAFLLPFIAVGLVLIAAAGHALLALFNPRVAMTLDPPEVPLGGTAEVRWAIAGRYDRIERLEIRLEGHEEATYRQGTNTYTDKTLFFTAHVVDTTKPLDVRAGRARVAVPADAMHSFAAKNNKVVWTLVLQAHIRAWPDVKDEYVLAVAPAAGSRTTPSVPTTPEVAWT